MYVPPPWAAVWYKRAALRRGDNATQLALLCILAIFGVLGAGPLREGAAEKTGANGSE